MKKNITVNISGIIFHIDEDAYEKLAAYLGRIRTHFAQMEGADEILGDIESRIAEMLQEHLNESKHVITIEDVDQVISVMGQPYEFSQEEDDEGSASSANDSC